MNRGDRREPIFRGDADRILFLNTLGEACAKTEWQVHAYCLMENHFHLVLETPEPNLVTGMKWFLGTYTARFNHRHQQFGHLFSGRYKSLIVDGSGNGYLGTVCDYVHLNPARAKLLSSEDRLETYRWSSYPYYLHTTAERPVWLRVDRVFGEAGIPQDTTAGRRELALRTEARRQQESGKEWQPIRSGWCLGDEPFRQELLDQMTKRMGTHHYGEEKRESALHKAEQLVQEEFARLGWEEAALTDRRKTDQGKVEIARRLRTETTVSLQWIARRLHMGAVSTVANALSSAKSSQKEKKTSPPVSGFSEESSRTQPSTPPDELRVSDL